VGVMEDAALVGNHPPVMIAGEKTDYNTEFTRVKIIAMLGGTL